MKRAKPPKWGWSLCLGMVVAGAALLPPFFPDVLRERLSQILIVSGFAALLILWRQKEVYEDLPWEEQQELERENRLDERKVMLRGRAAWLAWQAETVLLLIGYAAVVLVWDRIDFLRALPNWAFSTLLLFYWFRVLFYELIHWWLNRKY